MKKFTDGEIQNIADRIVEDLARRAEAGGEQPGRESRLSLVTPFGQVFESGQIFEAQTVKGGTNYVLFLMQMNDWVYYAHGDRSKKVEKQKFIDLIGGGELNPIDRKKADPERIALCVLGLQAMANGLSFNDYLKVVWGEGEGSQAY